MASGLTMDVGGSTSMGLTDTPQQTMQAISDVLSEGDVTMLHEVIAYKRASKLAEAVYTIENVMACIKGLMIDYSAQSLFQPSILSQIANVPDNQEEAEKMATSSSSDSNSNSDCDDTESGARVETDDLLTSDCLPAASQPLEELLVEVATDNSPPEKPANVCKRKTLPRQTNVNSEATFTCEKCGYQTRRKDHLKRHLMTHTNTKPVQCDLCSFTCTDKYQLIRHLKSSVHDAKKKSMAEQECNICGYKTSRANRMTRHKRTHSGEKPYACTYCTYRAAQQATLDRHILTHTGEKPFKCEKCEYCAADTKSLRFHTLQKHTIEEGTLYRCTECDYSTPVSSYYKLHMRAHSDARPYLCDICGFASKRPHGLTKHYRAVHGWSKSDTDGKVWRKAPADTDSAADAQVTPSEPQHAPESLDTSIAAKMELKTESESNEMALTIRSQTPSDEAMGLQLLSALSASLPESHNMADCSSSQESAFINSLEPSAAAMFSSATPQSAHVDSQITCEGFYPDELKDTKETSESLGGTW